METNTKTVESSLPTPDDGMGIGIIQALTGRIQGLRGLARSSTSAARATADRIIGPQGSGVAPDKEPITEQPSEIEVMDIALDALEAEMRETLSHIERLSEL